MLACTRVTCSSTNTHDVDDDDDDDDDERLCTTNTHDDNGGGGGDGDDDYDDNDDDGNDKNVRAREALPGFFCTLACTCVTCSSIRAFPVHHKHT